MAQQIYLIIQQDEILLDKMINPNNWKRLENVTTSNFKTNNMAQTAVEWLEEQLNKWSDGRFYLPPHLFEKAKEIEKQQIVISTQQGENPSAKETEQ